MGASSARLPLLLLLLGCCFAASHQKSDSCAGDLPVASLVPFDSSAFRCITLWKDEDFILRVLQEHGDQPVELRAVGAGQEVLRRPRLLRQGPHGRQQRHAWLVLRLRRQARRQAVLPAGQEPRGGHSQRRPPHPRQEQDRHRLALRPALPGLRAQHRPTAAVPHLLRGLRGQPPFLRRLHHPDAPRHGLPLLQIRLRVAVERRRVGRGGVPDEEVARAAVHDGVGRAAAHGHDGGALLPAAGPLLVLRPHGRAGAGLRRRHRGGRARLPAQRGRAQQHRRAQGHRHLHPLHGMPPGDGGAGAAGTDVQGAAVLELVPPQHRARGHPAGHGQRLPRPHHRQGGERIHRLLRSLRRRLGHGRRRIRVQALLRGRRRLKNPSPHHPAWCLSCPSRRRAIA